MRVLLVLMAVVLAGCDNQPPADCQDYRLVFAYKQTTMGNRWMSKPEAFKICVMHEQKTTP